MQGENKYHAILGRGMGQTVLPPGLAPALVALDARVRIISSRKEREISLEEMYTRGTNSGGGEIENFYDLKT